MVQATIAAPAGLAHQFSKQNLRRADVYLMGVNWETMDFVCGNPECARVTDGFGNYVTRLESQAGKLADALRAAVEALAGEVTECHGEKCRSRDCISCAGPLAVAWENGCSVLAEWEKQKGGA